MRLVVLNVLLLTSTLSLAQKISANSLAIGLKNGFATVTLNQLNTAHIGVGMDHQRNFNQNFSLRTAFHISYILPAKRVGPYYNQGASDYRAVYETSSFQGSLRLMPAIYHRDEKFNLYLGLAGGLGYQYFLFRSYDEYYVLETDEYRSTNKSKREKGNFQIGYSPVLGVGFNLGDRKAGSEIEISLSYERWYQNISDWEFSNTDGGYTGFALQTTYRYNFN